jgi:hypothetical protein
MRCSAFTTGIPIHRRSLTLSSTAGSGTTRIGCGPITTCVGETAGHPAGGAGRADDSQWFGRVGGYHHEWGALITMMGCVFSLLLTIAPRIILLFMWLFTPRVSLAFENWIVPLLGFIFLPFTMLAYVLAWDPTAGTSFGGWLLIFGGLLFDLGSYAISAFAARSRRMAAGHS